MPLPPSSSVTTQKRSNRNVHVGSFLVGLVLGFVMRDLFNGYFPNLLIATPIITTTIVDNDKQSGIETCTTTTTSDHSSSLLSLPLQHTPNNDPIQVTIKPEGKNIRPIELDTYNYFHHYVTILNRDLPTSPTDNVIVNELPMLHTWMHFMEAYGNHMDRFRNRRNNNNNSGVVFMEIGVQSGGKIPMLRDYFGPTFTYIGIDINPSTKLFESKQDKIFIEIGDSGDATFLQSIKKKYPIVDILLDDGGHTMHLQRLAMKEFLPHIAKDGIYICEDLATSWSSRFQGMPQKSSLHTDFVTKTMVGLIHQSLDWLNAGFVYGAGGSGTSWKLPPKDDTTNSSLFYEDWWRVVTTEVKHIHYYNQLVVYEKTGHAYEPFHLKTVGRSIPYTNSGKNHVPVQWKTVMKKLQQYTNSTWNWDV